MTTESWTIAPVASRTLSTSERLVHTQLIGSFEHQKVLDVSFSSAAAYRASDEARANNILRPSCLEPEVSRVWAHDRESELQSELESLVATGKAFDAIVAVGIFEHLREPIAFLERLLKLRLPGGQIAVAVLASNPEGDRLPIPANERFATLRLLTEGILGVPINWTVAHAIEGIVFRPVGQMASHPDVDHSDGATQDENSAVCWLGIWGTAGVRTPLLRYLAAPASSRLAELESSLQQARADARRLEAALAEERRLNLSLRQRLNTPVTSADTKAPSVADETFPVGVCVSPDSVRAIAMEVWFEKQRWGLPYKIMKMLKSKV